MTVGILIVSHSAAIATGTVELARQMAADVPLVAAGGTDDGGIGTSFEAITAGIEELAAADAVVVLCDLGSAYLTTDTALDFLDDDLRARVHVSQAPLVEGAVAAAVADGYPLNGVYPCPGSYRVGNREFRNFEGQAHGNMNLHRALVVSCDTIFYKFAYEQWLRCADADLGGLLRDAFTVVEGSFRG